MRLSAFRRRPTAAAVLLSLASLLSCGREVTGPGGRGRPAEIQLAPVLPEIRLAGNGQPLSISSVVDFARVRVVLLRTNGDTAVNRTIDFPAGQDSLALRFDVVLGDAATNEGEPFQATMQYISATGDTVFRAGPATVIAKPLGAPPAQPPSIPTRYVGRGANAATLTLLPSSFTGTTGQQVTFTSEVRDSAAAVIPTVPVAYTSSDSQRVSVNIRTGVTTLLGARGSALIVGQTLTGPSDTALVTITPTAAAITLVSGGGQQVRQGLPFPQPVRVRVDATDGIGVAGVPVLFAVLSGAGSTSQTADTTDANGFAEVTWTAGEVAGAAQLRATVQGTAIAVTVPGTQLSSAPTQLTFEPQPVNIVAGEPLPAFSVVVRDAVGDTVRGFNGEVDLTVVGGTVGASLVGERGLNAVNGVMSFSGMSVNRGGTGYRLVASIAGGPTAQSNLFDVAPAPPANLTVVGGGNQTVPPSTTLPDSVVVRVTDTFGFARAGVTVNWSVASGGGAVSPTSSVTDANGRAATQWTVGAAGFQQIRAQAGSLEPISIAATILAGGGAPVLFLPVDAVSVSTGRTRPVTIFLTNPTPAPLTVDFTMRSGVATWGAAQLVIPTGGTQLTALISGVTAGLTTAVVSSSAGTDSMVVNVDSAAALIDLPLSFGALVGDTIRTFVLLEEPAPVGGLSVVVRSADSSRVLVAPGSGRGPLEPSCWPCADARADGSPTTVLPDTGGKRILAPPSGTATITIPAGQQSGVLVILPIAPTLDQSYVPILLDVPGFVTTGTAIQPRAALFNSYCNYCTLAQGHRDELQVSIAEYLRRDLDVRLRSLDPSIAVPLDTLMVVSRLSDSYWDHARIVGLAPGQARIAISAPGFEEDTLTYTVLAPRLSTYNTSFTIEEGASADLVVYLGYGDQGAFGYGAPVETPVPVSVVSRNPGVVRVDRASRTAGTGETQTQHAFTAIAPGVTWLVYSAPGRGADSTQVTVFGATLDLTANFSTLGVGLVEDFYVYGATSRRNEVRPISVTSSDPAVLEVLTPAITLGTYENNAIVRIAARSPGVATLTFASPGVDTATFVMTTTLPSVVMTTFSVPATIDADSAMRGVSAVVATGSRSAEAADSVQARLRSTDPSVLLVTDSVMIASTGGTFFSQGEIRAINAGTARLVVEAPGFLPDTSAVITVRPLRLQFTATTAQVGNGLVLNTPLSRLTPPGSPLIVDLSIRGPSGAMLVQPVDTFPAGGMTIQVGVVGGSVLANDTLIATAPGLAADTVIISTVRSRIDVGFPYTIDLGTTEGSIGAFLYGPTFVNRSTAAAQRFVMTSRDTTVLRVVQDTIRFDANTSFPSLLGAVAAVAPGQAWLVVTSLDGSVDADSSLVTVEVPRLTSSVYLGEVMGMQQRSFPFEHYIERRYSDPDSLWVRLQSSAPSVVTVPDSVLIGSGEYYAYFEMAAGDSVGAATVTFTANGHVGGSFIVRVTRSRLDMVDYDQLSARGRLPLDTYLYADGGSVRPASVDIPLRFTVRDATLARVSDDTTTIRAGTYYAFDRDIIGLAPGLTAVTVEDRRTSSFARVLSAVREVSVQPAVLRFAEREYRLAAGATANVGTAINSFDDVDSVWVRLRTLGGRAQVVQDSVLIERYEYGAEFDLRGVTPGLDTLILEAPGFRTDSAIVWVSTGIIRTAAQLPATIQSGDSVRVDIDLLHPDGGPAYVATAEQVLTFAASAGVEVRRAGAPVTSVVVPTGTYRATVWLRGVQGGPASLTVSSPGYSSMVVNLTVRQDN